jgi:excisionase family DNA binding protein
MTERLAFSIAEVAEQVGVSKDTVKRAIAKGHLPIRKIGRLTRIDRQDRDEWLLAGRRTMGRNKAVANK